MNKTILAALGAALLSLASASQAQAWGGFHSGYTYRAGGSFYHTGSTAAYGPFGEHTSSHTMSYNPYTGFSHSGYGQSSGYGGSSYHASYGAGGYGRSYGAYRGAYGGYGGYAGAYRRW